MRDIVLDRLQLAAPEIGLAFEALQIAGDARQVGKSLVVQIHADGLPGVLQLFGQMASPDAKPLGARFGLHPLDFPAARQFALLEREHVGGEDVGDDPGIVEVGFAVGIGHLRGERQRADDPAFHQHRHMQAGPQAGVEDRLGPGALEMEARIGLGIGGDDVVDLAHEKGADGTDGDGPRAARLDVPFRVQPRLVGGDDGAVGIHQGHVDMVMRQDVEHRRRNRLDDALEIELTGDRFQHRHDALQIELGTTQHGDLL